jgi:hypothetical protein
MTQHPCKHAPLKEHVAVENAQQQSLQCTQILQLSEASTDIATGAKQAIHDHLKAHMAFKVLSSSHCNTHKANPPAQ